MKYSNYRYRRDMRRRFLDYQKAIERKRMENLEIKTAREIQRRKREMGDNS